MSDTQADIQIVWKEILKLLPRIQSGVTGESRVPIFIQELSLRFDTQSGEFVLSRDGWGLIQGAEIRFSNIDDLQHEFTRYLTEYYKSELDAAARSSVYHITHALAEQIPYTQECTCADAEHGLMAADCHVHYDDPIHFFGDMHFACTCG